MTALATQSPFPQYFDHDGSPLNGGLIYFGLTSQNPETAPTTVYWDAAATQPAAQPIVTSNGYTVRAGTPAVVYAVGDYSLTVKTSRGRLIYTAASSMDFNIAQQAANATAALAADLANNTNAAKGSALVGYLPAGAGGVGRTVQDKLRDMSVSAKDAGAVGDGVTDDTTAIQVALNNARKVIFTSGSTFLVNASDINIPANTQIIIEKGAAINTSVRWTAYNVNNVEWLIDGIINVTSMTSAPAKVGWPSDIDGRQIGPERGFIEFGGSSYTSALVGGNTVRGSGKIIGPWVGAPPSVTSPSASDLNRKGIAHWNCKNVLVENIDISGFEGEQVYAYINTSDCTNVVFNHVYSHACKFNALNFNVSNIGASGAWRGLKITNCIADACYAGIEASAGMITGNYCSNTTTYGIWIGVGAGAGPITIADNIVESCALQSYVLSFSSSLVTPIYNINIHDNLAINSGSDAFACNKLAGATFKNNKSRNHASSSAGKAFSFTNCTEMWVDGNITFSPGAFSTGNLTTTTSVINLGSNPVILAGGTTNQTVNATFYGFGGYADTTTTFGDRKNQFVAYMADVDANGAGAELVFKSGSSGANSVYASIAGLGSGYDGSGTTGGIGIACVKSSTSQALPTLAVSWSIDGKMNLFSATTAAQPAYGKGAVYFDTTLNKLRVGGASAWETVSST